jgi:hypothetical protein
LRLRRLVAANDRAGQDVDHEHFGGAELEGVGVGVGASLLDLGVQLDGVDPARQRDAAQQRRLVAVGGGVVDRDPRERVLVVPRLVRDGKVAADQVQVRPNSGRLK